MIVRCTNRNSCVGIVFWESLPEILNTAISSSYFRSFPATQRKRGRDYNKAHYLCHGATSNIGKKTTMHTIKCFYGNLA